MKLALVTPWFGEGLNGGAERLAWDLAHEFRDRDHAVTVLTTCSRSWHDPWNRNSLPAGTTTTGSIRVSRFRVDKTDPGAFREINRHILATPRARLSPGARVVDESTEAAFVQHNISSSAMLAELVRNVDAFDRVVFMPYLYGTTLRGWHIPRGRAAIVPCLHDEPYAYLSPVAAMVRDAPLLLFNSAGEYELALRLYGPSIAVRSVVVGSAVAAAALPAASGPSIAGFSPESSRYVLFVGRNRAEKNLETLLEAYARFRALEPASDLRLVLAGEGTQAVALPGVAALGPVDDVGLARLYGHARAVAQPSANESFSRVLVEAWSYGRPAIVHADCLATTLPMRETGAGWIARTAADWQRVLHHIDLQDDATLDALGSRAREWVARNASWPSVIANYERALARDAEPPIERSAPPVVHVVAEAGYGDALTDAALRYDGGLRSRGWRSSVASARPDPRLGGLVRPDSGIPDDALRITYLDDGTVRFGPGASSLQLSPFFDFRRWNIAPDEAMVETLRDDRTTILAVGPIAAANHQLDIFDIFSNYLTFDFDARLALVGPMPEPEYAERLYREIERAGLEHRVLMPGVLSLPALAAFYRGSDLFVSHQTRYVAGGSIVDAMAFDVPVCAIANASTRSILGGGGVLVTGGRPIEIAALWRVIVSDHATRDAVIRSQRTRLRSLSERTSVDALETALLEVIRA